MVVETLPIAETEQDGATGLSHLYCCDPDLALCGEDLTGGIEIGADEPTDCFACVAIDEADVPCRSRFCRVRSWWRDKRFIPGRPS